MNRPDRVESAGHGGELALSALFDDPAAVERALTALTRAGVPRDLVEVVVSPEAARRYYPQRARSPGREAMRYAGAGALIGLIAGASLSLALVAIPGFHEPGGLVIVQLLGPNLMTVGGAVVGAVVGWFTRRRGERRHARVRESPDAIVVIVTARSAPEAAALARTLHRAGGRETRTEE